MRIASRGQGKEAISNKKFGLFILTVIRIALYCPQLNCLLSKAAFLENFHEGHHVTPNTHDYGHKT